MATLNIPNTFANATTADATEVNANFNAIKSLVEAKLVDTDGVVQANTAAIANSAVTTAKIADGAVTAAKISGGAIGTSYLADGAVTSAKIADGTIVAGDIADGAVTSAKILDGTIMNVDINASAAIALSKLATGALPTAITIDTGNITALAVTTAKIADNAVNGAKISGGSNLDIASVTTSGAVIATGNVQTFGNVVLAGDLKTTLNTNDTFFNITNGANSTIMGIDSNQGVNGHDVGSSSIRAVYSRSTNVIGFSSSSRRFKENIEDYVFDEDAVRAIKPVRFKYIQDVQEHGSNAGWNYGFIAEDALDAGVPELVGRDEQGQVDYFAYERMCVAQQQLIRTLFDKVEALEAKVTELEGK